VNKALPAPMLGGESIEWRFRDMAESLPQFFHGSPSALALTRLADGAYLDANAAYSALIGYTREEIVGHTAVALQISTPEARENVVRLLGAEGTVTNFEMALRHKSGELRHVLITAQPTELSRVPCLMVTVVDITARKLLERQLQQSQKMQAIGKLTGGVAHDFNNLLTVIDTNSELLTQALPASDEVRELLTEIQRASEQAAALTRQLLAFSHLQIVEPKVLDLNDIVVGTARMLGRVLGEDVELKTRIFPDLPSVRIDPAQAVQVLMNLAVNARDAMPHGGRLLIETRLETVGASRLPRGARPGAYVLVAMMDTGAGMTSEIRERLFEPFFTTKEGGKGNGLGLAVVRGIVAQSGGFVEVESEPGRGTVFRVYLPTVDGQSRLESHPPSAPVSSGRERLLLVEDNDAVRRVGLRVLRAGGYTVTEARTGEEAIARLERADPPIDLVVTDVVMPGMSGPALADVIRERWPGVAIIFTSGYADDAIARSGVTDGESDVPFVQKPYTPAVFLSRVREVLDRLHA
jgi:PAS domain S-box-containing protein